MTTFNAYTDLNARGRHIMKTRHRAEAEVWHLVDLLPAFFNRTKLDGQKELDKLERREAARRSVDNLLR